jgi:Zn-dependent protease
MRLLQGGLRLGQVRGIEVTADWSLCIIFGLISFSLGAGVFPAWHPDWSTALNWAMAIGAALAFFVSLFLHELSHALVGRAGGIDIHHITLFMFGGVAHMENEPPSWKAEFAMAIVGPITSLVLGFLFLFIGDWVTGPVFIDPDHPRQIFSQLGPGATLLAWLGPINIVLAVFNLIPGFPLDGGRVLRAVLWGATGDLVGATRLASRCGQLFGFGMAAAGVALILGLSLPFFGRGLTNGLWLMLIGGFLANAARNSYRQLLVKLHLGDVPVDRLMLTELPRISPELPIRMLAGGDHWTYPVEENGRLLGLVSDLDLPKRPRETWEWMTVTQVMTPVRRLATLSPRQMADEALDLMADSGLTRLAVVEGGRFVGLLRKEELVKWLALFTTGSPRSKGGSRFLARHGR